MSRVVVFNYNSRFIENILTAVQRYNDLFPEKAFTVDMYKASECPFESLAGQTNAIIHSGGDGEPVREDNESVPKLYICHSHQWKARKNGGKVIRLRGFVTGIQTIDLLEDDEILGRRGKIAVMKYHSLAVIEPPPCAKVLAKSKIIDTDGREIEAIEALRYAGGSVSIQGHPEEGTAYHIFHNFFERIASQSLCKQV